MASIKLVGAIFYNNFTDCHLRSAAKPKQLGGGNMAYSGWLLKIGNYTVPMSFMKPETYSPYVNMQDLDDYTDANGYLHRNAVELKAVKS